MVFLDDANTKSSDWYKHDKNTYEGSRMNAAISQFGLQQLITESTHILGNCPSCIDLIFTSNPSLAMDSGVYPSLHSNYRHHITYAKFNLKIHYPYPYKRETWHCQKANTDQIRKATEQFSWDRSFKNIVFNEMVSLYNRNTKHIISNYIPHETIICDDREPPWLRGTN